MRARVYLPAPGGAAEDDGVGEASGGDGGAELLDGVGVADEVVEVGWQCHPMFLLSPRGTYCAKVFDSCELSLDL